jgi:hypothetical protein
VQATSCRMNGRDEMAHIHRHETPTGAPMYELDYYRKSCLSAQGVLWDTSVDYLRERRPDVFTDPDYVWVISRRTDGKWEKVETSPNWVVWKDYMEINTERDN